MTTFEAYAAAMDVCDPELGGHAARVSATGVAIARRLDWNEARICDLELGAALHDVGKVNIRPAVLEKPGRLDPAEIAAIRAHPVEGAWLIAGIRSLQAALPYVLFHHERWDGDGYPTGRSGAQIPIGARVLAVVDAFDAMTSDRPYRRALPVEAAIDEVDRCAGGQFDPVVARVFVGAWMEGKIRLPERRAAVA
jgi:HD-GYP domain-containing protein (c-di-GMP phosphodiesterase class II)